MHIKINFVQNKLFKNILKKTMHEHSSKTIIKRIHLSEFVCWKHKQGGKHYR